jgi:DNA polymerase lambda
VKHPQLDLQPLYEVGFARPRPKTKTAVTSAARIPNSNPPTSPIEEISVVLPPAALENQVKDKTSVSKTSDLYSEVKERIAKHSRIKQHDKLLKRGSSKMTAPVDESSIIYVSSSPSSRESSPILAVKSALTVTTKQGPKTTKLPAEKRKGKEKPQPMTPTEYARSLNEKLAAAAESSTSKPKKRTPVKFLEGKYIFYTGGDMKHASEMTRGRMDLVGFLLFSLRLSLHISISDCKIRRESFTRI